MHFLKLQTTGQIKIKREALSGVLEVNPFEIKPHELVSKLENLHQQIQSLTAHPISVVFTIGYFKANQRIPLCLLMYLKLGKKRMAQGAKHRNNILKS